MDEKSKEIEDRVLISIGEECEVYRVNNNGQPYALKVYTKATSESQKNELSAINQLTGWENIIQVCKTMNFKKAKPKELALEYCEFGSLSDCLTNMKRNLYESEVKEIFFQIIKGLYKMHSCRICHGNLKLSNILLNSNGIVKISGFRHSFKVESFPCSWKGNPDSVYSPLMHESDKICFAMKADIYSAGIILYELLKRECPAREYTYDYFNKVDSKEKENVFFAKKNLQEQCQDLYEIMVDGNEILRCDLSDVLTHPWLKSYSFSDKDSLKLLIQEWKNNIKPFNKEGNFICFVYSDEKQIYHLFQKKYNAKLQRDNGDDPIIVFGGSQSNVEVSLKVVKCDGKDVKIAIIRGNAELLTLAEDIDGMQNIID